MLITNRSIPMAGACLLAAAFSLPPGAAAQRLGEQEYKAYTAEMEKKNHYRVRITEYEKGDHPQAYSIGFACFHGFSCAPQDYQKAGEWFLKSAEKGDPLAYILLGNMLYCCKGMAVVTSKEDNPDGVALMKRAASRMTSADLSAAKKRAAAAIELGR